MRGDRNKEPSLNELLDDPLVILLMTRDGVTRSEIEAIMADMQLRPDSYENRMETICSSQTEPLSANL